jgi:hypothetical protein
MTDSPQPKWNTLAIEDFNFKRTSTDVVCVTLTFHIFANDKKCLIIIEITGPTIILRHPVVHTRDGTGRLFLYNNRQRNTKKILLGGPQNFKRKYWSGNHRTNDRLETQLVKFQCTYSYFSCNVQLSNRR